MKIKSTKFNVKCLSCPLTTKKEVSMIKECAAFSEARVMIIFDHFI